MRSWWHQNLLLYIIHFAYELILTCWCFQKYFFKTLFVNGSTFIYNLWSWHFIDTGIIIWRKSYLCSQNPYLFSEFYDKSMTFQLRFLISSTIHCVLQENLTFSGEGKLALVWISQWTRWWLQTLSLVAKQTIFKSFSKIFIKIFSSRRRIE